MHPDTNSYSRASLAHGTPPHIAYSQQDVPVPTVQHLCGPGATEKQFQTASVFIALASLTKVLDQCLQQIYNMDRSKASSTTHLELALQNWTDALVGLNRHIIMRGANMAVPGASNLRLAYLSMKLLVQRINVEATKQKHDHASDEVAACYLQARNTAEEVVIFTQDLQKGQIHDFWLPTTAFIFPSTINFMLRHAFEVEKSPSALAHSNSFRIARELVESLRSHKTKYGWEMGDVCLAQHAEIVDKVLANVVPETDGIDALLDNQDFVMPDASILDQFFPSLWDPLQNIWGPDA